MGRTLFGKFVSVEPKQLTSNISTDTYKTLQNLTAVQSVSITYSIISSSISTAYNELSPRSDTKLNAQIGDIVIVNCTAHYARPASRIYIMPSKYVSKITTTHKPVLNGLYDTFISAQIVIRDTMLNKVLRCYATNTVSNQTSSSLMINIISKPACVHANTQSVRVGVNREIVIDCLMNSPNPVIDEFEWSFSKGESLSKPHSIINQSSGSIKLVFTSEMIGSYAICTATNKVGSGSCVYQVKLGG
ncbi:hypothetical protein GJ496_010940 [Pomphorhynchus laevis]|nr:hypothetical protein GJ496_010940 [Pomphorhynchus laevis]